MRLRTIFYEYVPGRNTELKVIEGVLIPEVSRDASVEIDGTCYMPIAYGIIIKGEQLTASIVLR